MSPLLIYAPRKSNRLTYVLDWLFDEQLKTGYRLTHDEAEARSAAFVISYGVVVAGNVLSIPDGGLLWETGVRNVEITADILNGLPVLFPGGGQQYLPGFDIFSALFFLLSRYEEYYTYTPDKHGRYPATDSILYKKGWLEQPVADEWVARFRDLLTRHFSIQLPDTAFSYQPTYDIDIAWSYRHKGLLRSIGALGRDVLRGKLGAITQRISAATGGQDPYDSFAWLRQLHSQYNITPLYFILASLHTTERDKNIPPRNRHMRALIAELNTEGFTGLHPSYYSDKKEGLLKAEKQSIEQIINAPVTISRQHYIKLRLPETYRLLMASGIAEDHSMGYGTHLGFRAATGQPFRWYDLETEQATPLIVHPFCFMDTTAHFDLGLNCNSAFARLRAMSDRLEQAHSRLVTVFHNFSLGTEAEWKGWNEAYANFVRQHADHLRI